MTSFGQNLQVLHSYSTYSTSKAFTTDFVETESKAFSESTNVIQSGFHTHCSITDVHFALKDH